MNHGEHKISTAPSKPSTSVGNWGFDTSGVNKKMSIASRLIITMASKARITEKRRRNYVFFLAKLSNLQGCKPLFPILPNGVVPQVFPLVFHCPQESFWRLKRAGVPFIRFGEYLWEGIDLSTCPVSVELSRRLFQLPCHQELRNSELSWMIDQVTLERACQ
jgi:perosamine synthetase